jgi:carbon storage regulator
MLILTRRVGETIIIGELGPEQARVTVLGVKGNQVRIGLKVDRAIPVHREEVYERIKLERADDAASAGMPA